MLKLGALISIAYVLLVVSVWVQGNAFLNGHLSHGGAAGLQALVTTLTGLAVVYYLIETRRLREAAERQIAIMEQDRWPLIFPGFSREPLYEGQLGSVLWAKNVGGGPAVEVHIIGLTTSQPMAMPGQVSLISVVSPGGVPVTLIEWGKEARTEEIRQDVAKMKLQVRCRDQTGSRRFLWVWEGHRDWPGFFELRQFETAVGKDAQQLTIAGRIPDPAR